MSGPDSPNLVGSQLASQLTDVVSQEDHGLDHSLHTDVGPSGSHSLSDRSSVPQTYGDALSLMHAIKSGRVGASTNDQRFLLIFILSNYFGPDLKNEEPKRSAAQRQAAEAPPYSEADLHNSILKLAEIESIYYYAVRHAHPGARVKLQSLYKFLQGHLAPPVKEALEDDRQFTYFFDPAIHKQTRYKGTYKVVEGIIFINNPDTSMLRENDVARFLWLTSLPSLTLERDEARHFVHGMRTDRDEERQARFNLVTEQRNDKEHGVPNLAVVGGGMDRGHRFEGVAVRKKKKKRDHAGIGLLGPVQGTIDDATLNPFRTSGATPPEVPLVGGYGASLLLLPGIPTASQWQDIIAAARPAVAFTGTAALRQTGPTLGGVDIGECDDAYLFQCALPGVKKNEGEFNCNVECDGQVTIRGCTTTGAPFVEKNGRRFHMHTLNLCPLGPFSVTFHLPGPVEPSHFTGTFGSDGILEGIILKQRRASGAAALTFLS